MELTSADADALRVEMICGAPPVTTRATLSSLVARHCALRLDQDVPPLAPDTNIMLRLEERRRMEIIGVVARHEGRRIDIRIVRISHAERRYFPREEGGIELRYKRLQGTGTEAAMQAWRRGLFEVAGDDDWSHPKPFMNFSASGLRFADRFEGDEGDLLLLTFRLDGQTVWHRATATVVRCAPTPPDGVTEVAVDFTDVEHATVEALTDFTLDRQLAELARRGVAID